MDLAVRGVKADRPGAGEMRGMVDESQRTKKRSVASNRVACALAMALRVGGFVINLA